MSPRPPNFLIAGGVASGTSFLSHAIKDHPQIYLPRIMRPECGFFYKSWEYQKGEGYYLERWFHEVGDELAVGERSSLYLYGDFNRVAARIHGAYPEMRLIFCLRNPTERAWANYRFTALTGFETLSFAEALAREEERAAAHRGWKAEIQPNLYRARGRYVEYLEPFWELFGEDRVLCLKSEALSAEPERWIREVYRFLGVDPEAGFTPQVAFTSPNVRSPRLQALLRAALGVRLDTITEDFRKQQGSLLGWLVGLNLHQGKVAMPAEARASLDEFYAPYNQRLARRLGWDLSDWSGPRAGPAPSTSREDA